MTKPAIVKEINLNKPNDDVIGILEELLEDAKSGEINAIVFVTSNQNFCTGSGWANPSHGVVAMVGELEGRKARLIEEFFYQ